MVSQVNTKVSSYRQDGMTFISPTVAWLRYDMQIFLSSHKVITRLTWNLGTSMPTYVLQTLLTFTLYHSSP